MESISEKLPLWGFGYDRIVNSLKILCDRPMTPKEQGLNRSVMGSFQKLVDSGEIKLPSHFLESGTLHKSNGAELDKTFDTLFFRLDPGQFSTADTIYRHLIAHSWDVNKTVQSLKSWAQYRADHESSKILEEEFPSDLLDVSDLVLYGKDPIGIEIIYERVDPEKIQGMVHKDVDQLLRYDSWVIEYARIHRIKQLSTNFYDVGKAALQNGKDVTKEMDEYSEKVVTRGGPVAVIDVSKTSYKLITDRKLLSYYTRHQAVLNDIFPETLATLMMINSPWYFTALWSVFKPFVSPWVQKRVRVVRECNTLKELDEVVGLENVPKEFGGNGKEPAVRYADIHRQYHNNKRAAAAAEAQAAAERLAQMKKEEERMNTATPEPVEPTEA